MYHVCDVLEMKPAMAGVTFDPVIYDRLFPVIL